MLVHGFQTYIHPIPTKGQGFFFNITQLHLSHTCHKSIANIATANGKPKRNSFE